MTENEIVAVFGISLSYLFCRNFTTTYVCNAVLKRCELTDLPASEGNATSVGLNRCALGCVPTAGLWPMPAEVDRMDPEAFSFLPGDVILRFEVRFMLLALGYVVHQNRTSQAFNLKGPCYFFPWSCITDLKIRV